MYIASFGLAEKPFAITPDPRYLYLGRQHADALAHLVYGINDAGGFIQLTGEVGTGKTTTIRSLLARSPNNADIALIINPRLTPAEFVQAICEELGVDVSSAAGNGKMLVDLLNRKLLRIHAEGRRAVLIVDEAQNLTAEVLEQVRLLTNLETDSQKLLQIILIGQPELRELLNRNDLRQLAQRVTARCHLQPLARDDTAAYVRHRLRVAGATSDIFTPAGLREVHRRSRGVPRVINVICDRALLGAYTEDRHEVDAALVRRAAGEVYGRALWPAWLPPAAWAGGLLLLLAAAGLAWRFLPAPGFGYLGRHAPARAAVVAPPVAKPKPPPTLAQALAADSGATTADAAFTALFALWNASYAPGPADPCTQAVAQKLNCVTLHSSLAQLRDLKRPAILMLVDDGGAPRQVVLAGIGTDAAELKVGERNVRVPISELSRYWYGDCVVLWRPPSLPVNELRPGMHGPAVHKLRTQLLQASSAPADNAHGFSFDDALTQLVEDFQRAHHLAVDGVAGIETQMLLDAVLAAPGTPLLQSLDKPPVTLAAGAAS
ncbi:MAG: AAA family ATPase [Proteobacteria bacterium]|nr:AAA family ATPase [Pseudomonadota bacterium]